MIRAVALDFDGVILESVEIKARAFVDLFADQPADVRERIVRLHHDHGGISRHLKFQWIYRDILGRELVPAEAERLGATFTSFCRDKLLAAPFVPGALEFLSACHEQYRLYLVSGTPIAELRWIVEARQLTGYFKRIWGSPTEKVDACRAILAETAAHPSEVAFVGDATTDMDAAEQTGMHFIARLDGAPGNPLESRDPRVRISDLTQLTEKLARW
jgi:phosphoglycolate phosphatase-like HAD superfamily hydrolase